VYAQTASALVEIPHYGAYTIDPFSQQIQFKFDSSIPQVAGPIAFVTNIPNAQMSDAKVYLLPNMGAGLWHRNIAPPSDTNPIASSAAVVSGSIYQVTPELPGDATGFLCLWVKIAGSDDRLYAIQIKK